MTPELQIAISAFQLPNTSDPVTAKSKMAEPVSEQIGILRQIGVPSSMKSTALVDIANSLGNNFEGISNGQLSRILDGSR